MSERYRIEAVLASVLAAAGALLWVQAPAFFSAGNLLDLLLAALPVLMVAVGATLVILTGEIDISVGSVFAIASVIAGQAAVLGLPMPAVALVTVVTGAALGAVNGALVSTLRLPSIVVTLATMVALRDGLRWITQGAWVQGLPPGFQFLGFRQSSYPFVALGVATVVLAATAWGLGRLPAGRAVYATGSNADAARLAGIPIAAVRFWVFVIGGTCTGLAALLNAVRFNQVPANAGLGLEMQVIAAVVVGGTAITGGRGTLPGTVLGVALLGGIGPALTFLSASPYWERALQGAIVLIAVGWGQVLNRDFFHALAPWTRQSHPGARA
ncbi:MAG TPA: ABC transporter permease [Vicinamibacterales bacterium]|nr:ABC transporter permease [Vicinamibacterales bacterium]